MNSLTLFNKNNDNNNNNNININDDDDNNILYTIIVYFKLIKIVSRNINIIYLVTWVKT